MCAIGSFFFFKDFSGSFVFIGQMILEMQTVNGEVGCDKATQIPGWNHTRDVVGMCYAH